MRDITYNERELLDAVARGDKTAFTELFHAYQKNVYTAALSIMRSEELAEDIVQDTFLKIWLKRASLSNVKDFRAYLFITARNFSLEMLRRIAYERRTREIAVAAAPAFLDPLLNDPMQGQRYQKLLEKALERLPERQRQVYQLMKNEGLKREAVARKLGIDPNTVKAHLTKAMRTIRAYCLANMEVPVCLVTMSAALSCHY